MDFELESIRCQNLPYYLDGKLREVFDVYKKVVHTRNTSFVGIIDGKSGMGKSTLSFQLAKYCDPNFSLDKVFFNPESFLEGLSIAQKGDCLIFDEAMIVSNRSTLSAINKMITQSMSLIRSKNLFIFFNVNSLFDLDKNLSIYRADILLHCYGSNLGSRGKVMAFFKGADDVDRLKMLYLLGKKYYDYSKPRSNFYAKFTSHFVVDTVEYEKKKQVGVNAFLSGTKETGSKAITERDRAINYIWKNCNIKQEEIAEVLGCSPRTIGYAISKYREDK